MSTKQLLDPEPTRADHDSVPTATTDCPDCDESLVDGQGLLFCPDCEWTGLAG